MTEQTKSRVLLILPQVPAQRDKRVELVEEVLNARFSTEIKVVMNHIRLSPTYYELLPHFIVLDPQNRQMVNKMASGNNCPEEIYSVPFVLIERPEIEGQITDRIDIPLYQKITPSDDFNLVVDKFEEVMKRCGLKLKEGKIEERLVQRNLEVEIKIKDHSELLKGYTTGLNRNGLGARVSYEGGPADYQQLQPLVDKACRVYFKEPDLNFMPAEGKILRVEESRNQDQDVFVAIRFNPNMAFTDDSQNLEILKFLIENQEEDSVKKPDFD